MGFGVLQAFAGGWFFGLFAIMRSLVLDGLFDWHFLENLNALLLKQNGCLTSFGE